MVGGEAVVAGGFRWPRAPATIAPMADVASPAPTAPAPTPPTDRPRGGLGGRLAGLTPSGRARVPVAWALYDFANTIFSYAVFSTAIGL